MEIEWKDIPGYESFYQASNTGQIRSVDRIVKYKNGRIQAWKGKAIKPIPNWRGYLRVGFRKDGVVKNFYVHTLIALAFIGPRPKGMTVNHEDGDKNNNCYTNFTYKTNQENFDHAVKTGLRHNTFAERNHFAKLDPDKVRYIRASKESHSTLSKKFNVSGRTVYSVKKGHIWKTVV